MLSCSADGMSFECGKNSSGYACHWSDQQGCSDEYALDEDPGSPQVQRGCATDGGPSGVACHTNFDCPAMMFCSSSGQCAQECTTDADCTRTGLGLLCNAYGKCVGREVPDASVVTDGGCYPLADAANGWVCPVPDAGGCYYDIDAGYLCAVDGSYVPGDAGDCYYDPNYGWICGTDGGAFVDSSFPFYDAGPDLYDGSCSILSPDGAICPSADVGGFYPSCDGGFWIIDGGVDGSICEPPTGDLVQCWPEPAAPFPSIINTCSTATDCAIGFHQTDCCGNVLAMSFNQAESSRFASDENFCDLQIPACNCAGGTITTESGQTASSRAVVQVRCVSNSVQLVCQTYVP
jgi:hypothetical protein